MQTTQEQSAPVAGKAPAIDGLSDLDAMTFSCAKASLNAAAGQAAKVPSLGTYQFSYFKIISDSHHSAYEVHFKSNYKGEADLKYCVTIYCQQGWDPKTTQISVRVMTNERQSNGSDGPWSRMRQQAGACEASIAAVVDTPHPRARPPAKRSVLSSSGSSGGMPYERGLDEANTSGRAHSDHRAS